MSNWNRIKTNDVQFTRVKNVESIWVQKMSNQYGTKIGAFSHHSTGKNFCFVGPQRKAEQKEKE